MAMAHKSNAAVKPASAHDDVERIIAADHPDPFSYLGMHEAGAGMVAVRAFLPGAARAWVVEKGREVVHALARIHESGL